VWSRRSSIRIRASCGDVIATGSSNSSTRSIRSTCSRCICWSRHDDDDDEATIQLWLVATRVRGSFTSTSTSLPPRRCFPNM
jgi:hypothetical protein